MIASVMLRSSSATLSVFASSPMEGTIARSRRFPTRPVTSIIEYFEEGSRTS